MASRFSLSDFGSPSFPGPSFSTPLLFNGYQFGGTIVSGSGWENFSSDVRKPAPEIIRADMDWRYEHEARVMRELVRVRSTESTPAPPSLNYNTLYSTHRHRFGYEQRNPFLGCPVNANAVNSMPRQHQETGNFTGQGNEVFCHYAPSHNRDLRGIRVFPNSKFCGSSHANLKGNFPVKKSPEADFVNKLTAVRTCRSESKIPGNIPLHHRPEGSHVGKMPCNGSVTSCNEQIIPRPEPSIARKLPSDNHTVSVSMMKASIHNQEEEKGVPSGTFLVLKPSIARKLPSDNHTVSEIMMKAAIHNQEEEKGVPSGHEQIFPRPEASITTKFPSDNHSVSEIMGKADIHNQEEEKGVPPGNEQIFPRPEASMTKKFPSDNHTVSEITVKADIHNQEEEKGWRKENVTGVSSAKIVNSDIQLLHQLDDNENSSPGRSVCENGNALPENSKKRKRRCRRLRKSMKKKTQSSLETQPSIPGDKAVEELSCSSSKVETSPCSVEEQNAEGGSLIATEGMKKVKNVNRRYKDGMKKVKKFKRVSKRSNDERKFWCEMCNVEGMSESLMLIHRNGRKHLKRLRKNRGAVLVVSSNQIDNETIVKHRQMKSGMISS